MEFKDYYATLGVDKTRDRRRHQEGVPPARAQVPPGRQQGAGCGRTHVGDQRGEHRPVRSREARRLRRARSSRAGPGLPSAARLGRGLRVLRRRVRGGRGRVQRLLRQPVRPRGARATRRRCRVDARRRPPREGRDRPGRRVSRGNAVGHAALGPPRRGRPRRHRGAHARRDDSAGRARGPAHPAARPGRAGLRRRRGGRSLSRDRIPARRSLHGRRPRRHAARARRAVGSRARRLDRSGDAVGPGRSDRAGELAQRPSAAAARSRHSRAIRRATCTSSSTSCCRPPTPRPRASSTGRWNAR